MPPLATAVRARLDHVTPVLLDWRRRAGKLVRRIASANPYIVDTAIAALVWLALSVQFIVPRPEGVTPASTTSYFLTCLCAVPLIWRRRFPLLMLIATNIPMALNHMIDGVGQPLPYAGLISAYTVAAVSPLRHRMVMNGLAMVVIPIAVAANSNGAREYLFTFFTYFGAYALGRLQNSRHERALAVEARAEQLELTRKAEADRAVAAERARIARDMHDVLSHAVSIMIVQAEAGPVAVRRDPDRAERAFDAIAASGRDAMTQLRRMLGVLKEEEGDAVRAPQPTIGDLDALVAGVSATGPRAELTAAGTPVAVDADVQVSLYRIVQEALTNVVKHARAGSVAVRLDWRAEAVAVEVVDDGIGPTASDGRGHGMISFRERVAAHGGGVDFGPGPGGRGFRVRAEFPLAREERVVAG
ncbi:MAG TPA: histidine kinase [Phytomonospora sp.]